MEEDRTSTRREFERNTKGTGKSMPRLLSLTSLFSRSCEAPPEVPGEDERKQKGGIQMQMNIACGQTPGIVSKGESLGENHKEIQSLAIESDNRIQSEDSVKLTGWYYLSVLNVLKELERVGVVRSEVMIHTKYMLTEEA